MLISSIISLIFSCFIQGIISNYLGYTYQNLSIFSTIYILVALLVIRPFFESEKKYLIILVIFGLISDIAYTNTFILNTCIYLIVYFTTKFFHFFFPYNIITINISTLLGIFFYHIISFIFLFLLNYDVYNLWMLLKILTHSVLMTILYTSILYHLISLIQKKLDLKPVK